MPFKDYDNSMLESYLLDLITLIEKEASRAINRYNLSKSKGEKDNDYELGFALAYSRVISLMIQQTEAYNIPLSELSLDGIDPDKDLMPGV